MFIAHLPAGYLCARLYGRRAGVTPGLMLAGLAGGVLPDLDLVYTALFEAHHAHHHHRYWTHLPVFWLALGMAWQVFHRRWPGAERHAREVRVFLLAVASHLLLDSVAGDIWWLLPWLDRPWSLVSIPAVHATWWLNYLLHWTFALELTIVALAVVWERRQPVLPAWRWRLA